MRDARPSLEVRGAWPVLAHLGRPALVYRNARPDHFAQPFAAPLATHCTGSRVSSRLRLVCTSTVDIRPGDTQLAVLPKMYTRPWYVHLAGYLHLA